MSTNPIMVLQARAEARALLYKHGELELGEAVEVLWQAAKDTGAIDKIGDEGVRKIIRRAFEGIAEI